MPSWPCPLEEVLVQAIIMAAGESERLRPITEWLPKTLLPVGGRPIVDILLTNLRQAGISRQQWEQLD